MSGPCKSPFIICVMCFYTEAHTGLEQADIMRDMRHNFTMRREEWEERRSEREAQRERGRKQGMLLKD